MTTITPFQLFKKNKKTKQNKKNNKRKQTKKMIKKVIRVEMFRENLWIFDTGRGTRKGIIPKISWIKVAFTSYQNSFSVFNFCSKKFLLFLTHF